MINLYNLRIKGKYFPTLFILYCDCLFSFLIKCYYKKYFFTLKPVKHCQFLRVRVPI